MRSVIQTFLISFIISFGSIAEVVRIDQVNRKERGFVSLSFSVSGTGLPLLHKAKKYINSDGDWSCSIYHELRMLPHNNPGIHCWKQLETSKSNIVHNNNAKWKNHMHVQCRSAWKLYAYVGYTIYIFYKSFFNWATITYSQDISLMLYHPVKNPLNNWLEYFNSTKNTWDLDKWTFNRNWL